MPVNSQPPAQGDKPEGVPAVPLAPDADPRLAALRAKALKGGPEDVQRLATFAGLVDEEARLLHQRLRKQQHNFATLFEIVGYTSTRTLDSTGLQACVLRSLKSHFSAEKLLILRHMRYEDSTLACSAALGFDLPALSVPVDALLCQHALGRRFCFPLKDLPAPAALAPEAVALRNLGLEIVTPLIQETESPRAVLEGLLFMGPRQADVPYEPEDIELLNMLGKIIAISLRNDSLYRRSIVDDLTGVASRGHFDAQLNQEINRVLSYGHRSLGLVMLGLDHFKEVNDKHGHQSGDLVLQELARVLLREVRGFDLVARYGGEEFVVVLLEIDRARTMEVANRLRKAVEKMVVKSVNGEKLHITASFGVACFPDDATDKAALIQLADQAMYKSKALGRNHVTMFESPEAPIGPPLPARNSERRGAAGSSAETRRINPDSHVSKLLNPKMEEIARVKEAQRRLVQDEPQPGTAQRSASGRRKI